MEIKLNTSYSGAKTYKTADNARQAVVKSGCQNHKHMIIQNEEGRWFPVFIGMEAIEAGIHHIWHVVG